MGVRPCSYLLAQLEIGSEVNWFPEGSLADRIHPISLGQPALERNPVTACT